MTKKPYRPVLAVLAAAAALSAPFTASARSETCHVTSEKQIAALFDRWNASLQTGNPQNVLANYARKSVLLPTLSNTPRLTPEQKADYFEHFLARKPVGSIDSRSIEIDCNTAIDAGLYTFTFGDGSKANARYTFTYKWDGKQWLITSHHSSLLPEKTG